MNTLRPDAVEQLVAALMAPPSEGHCRCHWIDPTKLRILLWKNTDPQQPNTFILKIAEQKFIGFSRQDKKGEGYWKFRSFYEDELKTTAPAAPAVPQPTLAEEIEAINNKPINHQTAEDRRKWAEWVKIQASKKPTPAPEPTRQTESQENANSANS